MEDKFYSASKVAEILKIHEKTVQRYIREGKLHAVKVGKAWRISGNDLSSFVQQNSTSLSREINEDKERKITVSSVIDIDVFSMDEGISIINMLTASLNSKQPEFGKTTMNAQFIEAENKVRVMLYGNIKFTETIMWVLSNYTK
ncbi:MAG: helix-turn-helix domain-containing protein [Eubacteriales bacterium]